MARFSDRMTPEVVQVFWSAMARGEFVTADAAEAGAFGRRALGGWLPKEGYARGGFGSEGSLLDASRAGGGHGCSCWW
jgi:hypothetical protein